jgi:superfamily II DNA or RNA helicase
MFVLRPDQQEIVQQVYDKEQSVQKRVVVCASTGFGKCHGLNTPIRMADGSIKMIQDIKVGDKVMGMDSKSRTVTATHSGVDQLYKINPVKGEPWVCNSRHTLSLICNKKGKTYNQIVDIDILDYINSSKYYKHIHKQFHVAIDYPTQELPLDPYYIGLWLGDGSSRTANITNMDNEVIDYIYSYADSQDCRIREARKPDNKAATYCIHGKGWRNNTILNHLQELNLIQNKHIPQIYLTSDRQQRLTLLAGLIDSDGHNYKGSLEITQKNLQLAQDINYLCRSLGLQSHITNKVVNGTVYYKINISGDLSDCPVLIPRKRFHPRLQIKDVTRTGISITEESIGQYFGITVTGDSRYLLADYTVVHNSVCMAEISRYYCQQGLTVLTVVHRDNLIKQLSDTYINHGLTDLGYIKAGFPMGTSSKVLLASVQTMSRRKDQLNWLKPDVVLVDECHVNSHSTVVKDMLDALLDTYIIGFTATPMTIAVTHNTGRVSFNGRRGLAQYYHGEIVAPTPWELMEDGRLAEDVYFTEEETISDSDMQGLGLNNFGEYNTRDLVRLMEKPGLLAGMVDFWERYGDNRLTIVFTAGIEFSNRLADEFTRRGHKAVAVSANDSVKERDQIYKDFEARKIQILVNCAVLIEGFDVKAVEAVMLAKPIRSRANYIQMVGRGLRSFPGKKNCYILDLGYNYHAHGAIKHLTKENYRLDYRAPGDALFGARKCPDDPDKATPPDGWEFPKPSPPVGCGAEGIHSSATECPVCGYVFPVKKLELSTNEDLTRADTSKVKEVINLSQSPEQFYLIKRELSFRKRQQPTAAFAAFIERYKKKPESSWSRGQLTIGMGSDELYEFFYWLANWAHNRYTDKEEILQAFSTQVGLEFGTYHVKDLEQPMLNIARKAFKTARDKIRAL